MIWNQFKTLLLLATLTGILMFVGSLIGGATGIQFALVFSLIMNGIVFFFSDKIVLGMFGARPLDRSTHGWVYDIVDELAHTMAIPAPKLWLVQSPLANAFATGRSPRRSAVAVTSGLLDLLDQDELRGVLAHEMGHVKNRDVLVATVAATLASAIGYLAYMLRYAAFWGHTRNNRDRGGSPLAMLFAAILMPIAATLIQLAVSRSREYLADETAANYTRDPLALASALEKLQDYTKMAHPQHGDTRYASAASLFIVYPFTGNGWLTLFMTHPPLGERIKRLQALHERMFRR